MQEKPNQTTVLVELAKAQAVLFHTNEGEGFATFTSNGHRETHPIKSAGFRDWLIASCMRRERTAPADGSLRNAIGTLFALARVDGPQYPVFTRCAFHGEHIYIDLGDEPWRAVEVTPTGWSVITDPPVRFRRAPGMTALPVPVEGGRIRDLRRFVNVGSESDFILLVAFICA